MLSFAAGVMLCAAMIGLILPSMELGGDFGVFTTILGIFFGAFCVHLLDMVIPRLCISPDGFSGENIMNNDRNDENFSDRLRRVSLFVMAIALHNLPEGIAAGVGLGSGDGADAILIATAIALQNLPEGIIVTTAMLGVGVRPTRAFLISGLTGVIEIFGTCLGYFAVGISQAALPLILSLAGGTMLYVISEEMIPESHSSGGRAPTYFLLLGFSFMLLLNAIL
jgi:ZIP family zinc transporter